MPQTKNFGFPLWADTPPEGATGKTLRDAILGVQSDSLAQMLDSVLRNISDILSKTESTDNKSTYIDDFDNPNIDDTHYPNNKAVYDFVVSHTSKQIANAEATVFTPLVKWNGNTEGLLNILGMFYKVSDSIETPPQIKFDMSGKLADGTVISPEFLSGMRSDTVVTDFRESLGITIYQFSGEIGGVIAERAGTLPAALVEQMTGANPGADIPFEAGTYVLGTQSGDEFIFVSNAESCVSVKNYIDKHEADITDTLVDWDGNTEGLSNILGMLFKVSDNTYVPKKIVYRYAEKSSDGTVTLDTDYLTTDGIMSELAGTYGIYIPTLNGQADGIMIAKRSGVLPSAVVSEMLGAEVPVDVPYEAGTYVSNILLDSTETRRYLTEAFYTVPVKEYIDSKIDEIKTLLTSGEGQ